MTASKIQVSNLRKSFGPKPVLEGIDLEVSRGEVVALIGPSGSGKSTLLRCLNLLELPDAGDITIGDAHVSAPGIPASQTRALRSKTAMVFQSYHLFRNRTVLQNVTDVMAPRGAARADLRTRALELLARVGIDASMQGQYPATLSGGQAQRVSIARALAVGPEALLLDEPTSALDPELVAEVLSVIRDLASQDTTMLIVTHEMAFAAEVADRVIFMDAGKVVEEGPARRLIEDPQEPRTRQFLRQLRNRPAGHAPSEERDDRAALDVINQESRTLG